LRRAHHDLARCLGWARLRLRSSSYGGQIALPTLRLSKQGGEPSAYK
jgi:hypothetical protein